MRDDSLSSLLAAPQHAPRPLPLFLHMLRSETAAAPDRRAAALKGLERYQSTPRTPREDRSATVACDGRVALRDHGGTGPPLVFVPSLINPPFVLDLEPGNSLVQHCAAAGHRTYMVDWGHPTPADRDEDVAQHVERLARLLRSFDEPPIVVGYCIGGTLAIAAASLVPLTGLALLAAPWHFAGFGGEAREAMTSLWQSARPVCERLGLVPMEVLQSAFWKLDPGRTVAKFEALATADDATLARFVALEDWANGGAPLTLAAGRDMFDRFFGADDPGEGRWLVDGRTIDPAALPCPVLNVVSLRDRIVPAASSPVVGDRRELALGHVGMVVGRQAPHALWTPLTDWLAGLGAPT
jgi:polyhydroxyalkanoate synthase